MDVQPAKLTISYRHLEAKTPKELEGLMLKLQIAAKISITFTPPQHVNGKWSTWYLYDYAKDIGELARMKMEHNNKGNK